jgi:hypothetical protein
MKVSPSEPFKIVYSILNHEYLGYIFEAFAVQLTSQGEFSFQVQNISSKNIKEFRSGLDSKDFELVKLIDDIQQDAVLKKYNPKKLSQATLKIANHGFWTGLPGRTSSSWVTTATRYGNR